MGSHQDVGVLAGSVVDLLELGRGQVAEVAVEAFGVVPVDPGQGGEFDVIDALPWPLLGAGGAADEFGLVVAVDGLGQLTTIGASMPWPRR